MNGEEKDGERFGAVRVNDVSLGVPLTPDLVRPGRLVLAAGMGPGPGQKPATIRLEPDGQIYVNDRLAATDLEVTDALRTIALAGGMPVVYVVRCEVCGTCGAAGRP